MAWYYGTYSCGHEGRVNVIGPGKSRQWKIDKEFSGTCPECYKNKIEEKIEEEREKAEKEALEMELPELNGTEKQIKWAITIRQKYIDFLLDNEDRMYLLDYIINHYTDAAWYIDHRNIEEGIKVLNTEYEKSIIEVKEEGNLAKEILQEATVYPANAIIGEIVNIVISEDKIDLEFIKDENFRLLVKSNDYRWTGSHWRRDINNLNGPASDRAAEIGNKLLSTGFPVRIIDEEVRRKAVEGSFIPEQTRWILFNDRFCILWGRQEDLYHVARKLPGSEWKKPYVTVPVSRYLEVQDFANLYHFKFTEKSLKAIEEYINATQEKEKVVPVKVENIPELDGLQAILNSSRDILDDLKDE